MESLPPLPDHLALRTPSPEPTPFPPVNYAHANVNSEHSSQQGEHDLTFMEQQSLHTNPEREKIGFAPEEDSECEGMDRTTELQLLSRLPLSEFVVPFLFPSWRDTQETSSVKIAVGSGFVEARDEDSLLTFMDRLYESTEEYRETRPNYPEMLVKLINERHGQFSTSHFLETVVRKLDAAAVQVLDWFADCNWFEKDATRALGAAAYRNNFEAVAMLCANDVDVHSSISRPHPYPKCDCRISVMAYSQLPRFNENKEGPSDEMVAYLLGRGAKPTEVAKCSLSLLDCLLRQAESNPESFLREVQSVVACIPGFADAACETDSILETCVFQRNPGLYIEDRPQIFEYLLDRGAKTTYGSPLAALIYMDGPPELIRKLIEKTLDLNAYCDSVIPNGRKDSHTGKPFPFEFIHSVSPLQAAALRINEDIIGILLDSRADVNCPARGSGGVTPLQGVCFPKRRTWRLNSGKYEHWKETHAKTINIVKLLLDRGANVNAAPAWNFGLTALQAAAFAGNMELAKLLVSRGANVNAPACKYGGGTALAMAARSGRVDMLRYLLAEGATIPASAAIPQIIYTVTSDDNASIMRLLDAYAPDLVAKYANQEAHSRDYQEYEAEWAKDPTYVRMG